MFGCRLAAPLTGHSRPLAQVAAEIFKFRRQQANKNKPPRTPPVKASQDVQRIYGKHDKSTPPAPIGKTRVKAASATLEAKHTQRPAPEELASRNVLQAGMSPQMKMKRASIELSPQIGARPSEDELRKRGVFDSAESVSGHKRAREPSVVKGDPTLPRIKLRQGAIAQESS